MRSRLAIVLLGCALVQASAAQAQQLSLSQSLSQPPQATPQPDNAGGNGAAPVAEPPVSDVFGASLFRGRFAQQSFRGFNPDYVVSVGDRIDLKLWGAYELALVLEVDSQGNIFIPRVGPVAVANTRNADLNDIVTRRVKSVYRENVGVYASLANAEPVKVFVTGNVRAPGLYGAYASDSLLHFLDQAGGVDPDTGSFLDVRIMRGGSQQASVSLYDFLLEGRLPLFQFQDGDTIVVAPRKSTARVTGLVRNEARFEFDGSVALSRLLQMAGLDQRATHVQLVQNQTPKREALYLPLSEDLARYNVMSGDEVSVFADRQVNTIIARIEGEFEGASQLAMPYAAKLSDLLARIQTTPQSDLAGVQLYRASIATRQKEVIDQMLRKLEESVLNARSGTREEADLRTREAELVLKFVERARQIEPEGRLVLHAGFDPSTIDLQDGDVIRIPRKSNTVAVQGEVFFPSAFVHRDGKTVKYYIEQAGGLTQSANSKKILVVRPNGEMVDAGGWSSPEVQPGDEIMVLPKVDTKSFQLTKDLVQVLYQIALSAGVVLRI